MGRAIPVTLVRWFIEQVELIKGHTPDQSANSLGGGVNLRTASPLNMREKRRLSYNVATRWAPAFFEHSKERLSHPIHPIISVEYQEAFNVGGGNAQSRRHSEFLQREQQPGDRIFN
jgi:hypothetical protein